MEKTITLLGEPKSNQHIYKITSRGKFASMYMSKEGKMIKDSYQRQSRLQWANKPLTDDVRVHIRLYFGDKRVRDIDNYGKILLDSMTGIIYEDDGQIQKMTVEKFYDKNNPRIEVTIL